MRAPLAVVGHRAAIVITCIASIGGFGCEEASPTDGSLPSDVAGFTASDADGDGVPDNREGSIDANNNGLPAYMDDTETTDNAGLGLDSDGDGLTDVQEGTGDANANGTPAWLDATEGLTTGTGSGGTSL